MDLTMSGPSCVIGIVNYLTGKWINEKTCYYACHRHKSPRICPSGRSCPVFLDYEGLRTLKCFEFA